MNAFKLVITDFNTAYESSLGWSDYLLFTWFVWMRVTCRNIRTFKRLRRLQGFSVVFFLSFIFLSFVNDCHLLTHEKSVAFRNVYSGGFLIAHIFPYPNYKCPITSTSAVWITIVFVWRRCSNVIFGTWLKESRNRIENMHKIQSHFILFCEESDKHIDALKLDESRVIRVFGHFLWFYFYLHLRFYYWKQ